MEPKKKKKKKNQCYFGTKYSAHHRYSDSYPYTQYFKNCVAREWMNHCLLKLRMIFIHG